MASKKTSPKNSPPDASEDPAHALDLLAQNVGPADASLLEAYLAGTSDTELIKVGKTILSSRIVTDTARIYRETWGFFKGATKEQKKRLRGFSPELLALAVDQAQKLHRMEQELADKSSAAGTANASKEAAAAEATSAAIALRDQAYTALRDAASQDVERRTEIETAFGTAETVETLARGLTDTAEALRRWLKTGNKALLGRLKLANLDADYADDLENAAKALKTAAAHAKHRPASSKVTQGTLDRADGINVLLLGQIIRAFERAHDIDPTIPRLVPIATRRLFSRSGKKKTTTAGAPATVKEPPPGEG